MVHIKRAYEPAGSKDGFRVLVDRLWPRGRKKSQLRLDAWLKELGPSTQLRKEFGHNPKRWPWFQSEYKKELRSPEAREKIAELAARAKRGNVTLVYGARDEEHNNAVVLERVIKKKT